MSLYKAYKTNSNKVNKGVEVEFPEAMNEDGTVPTFYLAYAGTANKDYTNSLAKRRKGFRDVANIPEDVARKMLIEVFAESVVKNWKHMYNEAGEVLEYSPKACSKLFNDLPEFFNLLQQRASELSLYLQDDVDETAKN